MTRANKTLHLFLEQCILDNNKHLTHQVHHILHTVLGKTHSCIHRRFSQGWQVEHKNHK